MIQLSMAQPVVVSLTQPITFRRPHWWSVQARYAVLRGGEQIVLEKGTWLLVLGPSTQPFPVEPDQQSEVEYLYRLASGETVALDRLLTGDEANIITNPQAIIAMTAFRTLEQEAAEKWGVTMAYIEPSRPPFKIVKCPICGKSDDFTSLDFSSIWCSCNTVFRTRQTAGDPGFCVDAWFNYSDRTTALYLLPPCEYLTLSMVFKNSGDPFDMTHRDWNWTKENGCTPDKPKLTNHTHPSLRAGLHACNLGDIYNWRFDGVAPITQESGYTNNPAIWKIDGDWWPGTAYLQIGPDPATKQALADLARDLTVLDQTNPQTIPFDRSVELLRKMTYLPSGRVMVSPHGLPLSTALNRTNDERYLLKQWLISHPDDSKAAYAYPIWLIVRPIWSSPQSGQSYQRLERWEVVNRAVCPYCGVLVSPEEMIIHADIAWRGSCGERHYRLPHGMCRQVWELGWPPYLAAMSVTRQAKLDPNLSKDYYLVLAIQPWRRSNKHQQVAVIKLATQDIYSLWCRSHLAEAAGRDIRFGAEDAPLASFYRVKSEMDWGVDCFTGQSFAEQEGFVILDHSPLSGETKEIATDIGWGICFPDQGRIQWQANLRSAKRQTRESIETIFFAVKNLELAASAAGVMAHWSSKKQSILTTWDPTVPSM